MITNDQISAMRDEFAKIASKKEERKAKSIKKARKSHIAHKYVGPAMGSAVTGGTMGLAMSDKGQRLAKAKKGALAGIAGALLWKAVTRGYSKATGVPYKEVVASAIAKQAFAPPPSTKPISTIPAAGDKIAPLKPGKVPSKDANAPRAKRVNVVGLKGLAKGTLNKPPVTNA